MKNLVMFLIFAVVPNVVAQGYFSGSLFADHRAKNVGDVVTVLIVEYSSASSSADSKTSKNSSHGYNITGGQGTTSYTPMYGLNAQGKGGFDNGAETSRSGQLTGKITATITEVTAQGNLVITGERMAKVNGEEERTTITGSVRPEDVRADNTVYSFNVANANISYAGRGMVDRGQKPGIIVRFMQWLF